MMKTGTIIYGIEHEGHKLHHLDSILLIVKDEDEEWIISRYVTYIHKLWNSSVRVKVNKKELYIPLWLTDDFGWVDGTNNKSGYWFVNFYLQESMHDGEVEIIKELLQLLDNHRG